MFEHHKKNAHEKQTAYTCYAMAVKLNKISIKKAITYNSVFCWVQPFIRRRQETAFPEVFVPVISSKLRVEVKINFHISVELFEIFNEAYLIWGLSKVFFLN